jgi:hypothetical protein
MLGIRSVFSKDIVLSVLILCILTTSPLRKGTLAPVRLGLCIETKSVNNLPIELWSSVICYRRFRDIIV